MTTATRPKPTTATFNKGVVVSVTAQDVEFARWCAQQRVDNAARDGVKHINKFVPDAEQIETQVQGYIAEFVVCDALGVERKPNYTGHTDGGTDITAPAGKTINVKSTKWHTGNILTLLSKPITTHCLVLVVGVPGKSMRYMRIVGGIWTWDFYRHGERWVPKIKPTDTTVSIGQHSLLDWKVFRKRLMR